MYSAEQIPVWKANMDLKDKALVQIAIDALRALQRGAKTKRHSDLWQLAVSRVNHTLTDIEGDEEIAAIEPAPRAKLILEVDRGHFGREGVEKLKSHLDLLAESLESISSENARYSVAAATTAALQQCGGSAMLRPGRGKRR